MCVLASFPGKNGAYCKQSKTVAREGLGMAMCVQCVCVQCVCECVCVIVCSMYVHDSSCICMFVVCRPSPTGSSKNSLCEEQTPFDILL